MKGIVTEGLASDVQTTYPNTQCTISWYLESNSPNIQDLPSWELTVTYLLPSKALPWVDVVMLFRETSRLGFSYEASHRFLVTETGCCTWSTGHMDPILGVLHCFGEEDIKCRWWRSSANSWQTGSANYFASPIWKWNMADIWRGTTIGKGIRLNSAQEYWKRCSRCWTKSNVFLQDLWICV